MTLSEKPGPLKQRPQKASKPNISKSSNSEKISSKLFDALDVAIIIHELETGAILQVNQPMCEMYGFPVEEALSLDVGRLCIGLSPCSKEDLLEWMRKAADVGPQNLEWLAKDNHGRPFWVEMFLRRIQIDGQDRILATIRDITERKQLDSEQTARLKRAEAQNAVFLALAGVGADFQVAMKLITHHLAIQIGDLCILDMLDSEGMLHVEAISQPYLDGSSLLPDIASLPALPVDSPGAGVVAAMGESLRITDASQAQIKTRVRPQFQPYLDRFGIHSLVIAPMRADRRSIGAITLVKGSSSRPYSAEDQAMLQSLADRAALAIVNAKLNAENLRQAEELRQINAQLEQRVAERTTELAAANERLQRLAIEDALTGLANRRRFNEVMDEEIRRARRSGEPMALLLCDVDFFKRFNDHYGHQAGDMCLHSVGKAMGQVFRRAGELPARYGGEEFAVVLPNHDTVQAMRAAEKLKGAIEAMGIPHANSEAADHVTLSIGVISATTDRDSTASWFIEKADAALYRSKSGGRNCATLAESE